MNANKENKKGNKEKQIIMLINKTYEEIY